jgi:hypothetical protein
MMLLSHFEAAAYLAASKQERGASGKAPFGNADSHSRVRNVLADGRILLAASGREGRGKQVTRAELAQLPIDKLAQDPARLLRASAMPLC